MRFSARFVEPDQAPVDASGEIELPVELEQLTAQLRREAAELDRHYPAGGLDKTKLAERAVRPRRAIVKKLAWAGAVVAPLILLLPGAVFMLRGLDDGQLTSAAANSAANSDMRLIQPLATKPAVDRAALPEAPPVLAPYMPLLQGDSSSALFLNEVTAPEMEGMVDIWEEGAPPEADLSI